VDENREIMRRRKINIPKELLVKTDVMNTLGGGVTLPSVDIEQKEDHYRVDVRVPGVSPDSLKVDIEGNRLIVSRLIEVKEGTEEGSPMKASNVIHVLPIPNDVDLDKIRAHYDDKGLHVLLPHNSYASGYRKNVEIER
jgi:HSP20 family protein